MQDESSKDFKLRSLKQCVRYSIIKENILSCCGTVPIKVL